jgi:hypothetical protein
MICSNHYFFEFSRLISLLERSSNDFVFEKFFYKKDILKIDNELGEMKRK